MNEAAAQRDYPIDDANGFAGWLIDAKPGDRCIYHRGHLATDRDPSLTATREDRQRAQEADVLADIAWRSYDAGKVALTQKRTKDADGKPSFIYFATRLLARKVAA